MNRLIFITCFIFLFVAQTQAQTEEIISTPRFRLGIEAGVDGLIGRSNKLPMIRENKSSYYNYEDDYYGGFIYDEQTFRSFYFGIKPEYLIHRRFAVAAGVRFSFNKIVYDSDKDYFLWKINESADGTTNYVRIKDITQKNYYVGIPMEIRFFPREIDYPVRHYFLLGTSLNFLVNSNNDVSFKNSHMNKYDAEVSDQIDELAFHGFLYGGFGLKIGNTNQPFGNIEFHFPVLMLTNDKQNVLVNANDAFGFGVQLSFQIPLCKKHQLNYTVIN
jgi:hypothetical protein